MSRCARMRTLLDIFRIFSGIKLDRIAELDF
jgi:hypothetical protein